MWITPVKVVSAIVDRALFHVETPHYNPGFFAERVVVDGEPIVFADRFCGRQSVRLAEAGGDFVILKNNDEAAYQLAVVVDDADAGVDRIVRGDDLLPPREGPQLLWMRGEGVVPPAEEPEAPKD